MFPLSCRFNGKEYLYSKRKLSELLLTLDVETLAGKFSKVWK